MKFKAFVLFSILALVSSVAVAQPIGVDIGIGTLTIPFQDGSAVGLLDLNHDAVSMTGFETNFGQIGGVVNLNVGGVISEVGRGTPYGSIDYVISQSQAEGLLSKLGFGKFNFGLFGGYDFNIKDPDFWKNCRAGIKVSTEILGYLEK